MAWHQLLVNNEWGI